MVIYSKKTLFLEIIILGVMILGLVPFANATPVITNIQYSELVFVNQPNNITVNVSDNESTISTVLLSIVSPETDNYNMQEITEGIYEYNFTPVHAEHYEFYIWAMNSNGDSCSSSNYMFTSTDDRPVISNINDNPDPVVVSQQSINIYADVTDPDENLDKVWLEIRYPQNQSQNITMTNISGTFTVSYTPEEVLTYRYTIWANDTKGNHLSAQSCSTDKCYIKEYHFVSQNPTPLITDVKGDKNYFYIRVPLTDPTPNITLHANVTDPFGTLDKVIIIIHFPNGTLAIEKELSSVTEIYTHTYYPHVSGTHTYTFNATDISGTAASKTETFTTIVSAPEFSNININPIHIAIPIGDNVTIHADVTDPHDDADSVWIEITSPVTKKLLMTNIGGNKYEMIYILEDNGWHNFHIYANDSRNNIAMTQTLSFSDERATDEINVSMESMPFCSAKYDYLSLELASNYSHYSTYDPFINYGAFLLMKTYSLLSNCGNLDINITNNCMTLRKEVIEEGQENITITGDDSTHVIAYCCWNEQHLSSSHGIPTGYGTYVPGYGAFGGATWFCEWDKSLVSMPPFLINSLEEFWMYFSYELLYSGWYNITASADYERYSQDDCDTYGYNTDRCSCNKVARMTIRFLKEEEKGVYPEPIPYPIPIPVSGEFISEPDIVIIREMPEYIYQNNETCTLADPWNTCTHTKIKLILYNQGSKPAHYVNLNDTSIVSDKDHVNYCSSGTDACNPVAHQCINHSYYFCMEYNTTNSLSGIYFELYDPIEPRNYAMLEYRFIPTKNEEVYDTTSFYDFNATTSYIHKTQTGTFDINLTKNTTEDNSRFNPDFSDRLYLNKKAAFSYELDCNLAEHGENRNFPVDTYTLFDVNLRALLGKRPIVPLWETKINLPESWIVSGCSRSVESDCDCSYSNTEHWIKCEKSNGNIIDLDDLNFQFIAKTTEISDFLLSIDSFDNDSMNEQYIPGLFTISNPIEHVTKRNPDIVIIREMIPHVLQKKDCDLADPWSNCTDTKIRLIIYNRGAEIANDIKLKDNFEDIHCSSNDTALCNPVAYRCIEGTELKATVNETNTTNSTATNENNQPYTCWTGNGTSNESIEFNITSPIYPFDYRIIEYEFIPAKNLSLYDGSNYYEFNAEVNFKNHKNESMPTAYEKDPVYNPYSSNILRLSNKTVFDYDVAIDSESINDTQDRDFAYGIYTIFNVQLIAHTSDRQITAPWYVELLLPYSWIISDCSSDEVNCYFNNTQHWIKINGSDNLVDGQILNFKFNGTAREMKDFLIPLYSNDSSGSNPTDSNYIPGLWTVSRLTHRVNVTILEPYPLPVPEPTPRPTPIPTPIPTPVPEEIIVPDRQMILSIKPLNWTLRTYQGSAIPVMFEIKNLGNTTIENLVLDAVHFEGWEYGAAEIAKLEPDETVNRTIIVTPAAHAKPGYYVIPARGIINDTITLDIAFFQLHVLEGISQARLKIIEFSNVLELDQSTDTFIPILLKNIGNLDLHNITIELENLDDCITDSEFFKYDLKVNESDVAYFRITTSGEPKTCSGSMIISTDEGAFVFSTFKLTIKPQAPMIPADYTTIIILAIYALVLAVYALYRRKHTKKEKQVKEQEDNLEEKEESGEHKESESV